VSTSVAPCVLSCAGGWRGAVVSARRRARRQGRRWGHEAENYLRAAVVEGDPAAPVNLAGLLHQKGADAAAFALLRQAAESGDGAAYWILTWLLPPHSRTARETTIAYESATRPQERPVCVRFDPNAWRLDPIGAARRV